MPHNSGNREPIIGVFASFFGTQDDAAKRLQVNQSTVSRSLKRDPEKSFLHSDKYPHNVKRYEKVEIFSINSHCLDHI